MSYRDVEKVLYFRDDISPFLVHLTRDLARSTARDNLRSILSSMELRYGTGAISDARFGFEFDKQNPMKDLIVKSATETMKEKSPEMYIINQLGKRFEKLTVINEKDCITFKQKGWIEREEWREINDILSQWI